jgi:phosphatidylserine decarboxylase
MSAISYAAANVLRFLPRTTITRAMGQLADVRWSPSLGRAVVGAYSRVYDVRLDEAAQSSGWPSFDAFFTRPLRAGARVVEAAADAVVSPADGRLDSLGVIDDHSRFVVKGRPYAVEELVGDPAEASRYRGGVGCVVYLSPRDYHRVHSPVAGEIRTIRSLPGDYYPVNAVGVAHFPNLFARNRRVAIAIDTPETSGLGRVTVVMVAAMIVGRITVSGVDARDVPLGLHRLDPGLRVERGGEIGMFHLGSTAVVFLEARARGVWASSAGASVRYGERLLTTRPEGAPGTQSGGSLGPEGG